MRKILIVCVLVFVGNIASAKTEDFFNESTNSTCVSISSAQVKQHRIDGNFKIQRTCISNKWVDVYTIKDVVVKKNEFYKKYKVYTLKGDLCTTKKTEIKTIGKTKFKNVCTGVGKYGIYYIDGKKTSFSDFSSKYLKGLSNTPTATSTSQKDDIKNVTVPKPTASIQQETSVVRGAMTNVSWTTTNMRSCTMKFVSTNQQPVFSSSNSLNGKLTIGPLTSDVNTFLDCIGNNGTNVTRGYTIEVQ